MGNKHQIDDFCVLGYAYMFVHCPVHAQQVSSAICAEGTRSELHFEQVI